MADKKLKSYCFVIMSFGNNPVLQDHYELGIKPTVEGLGFKCIRADEIEHNEKITNTIMERMQNAQFIIADLTEERPNCYYELGYAHALKKNVILTINKESSIHFDVKDFNFIVYSRLQELKDRLTKRIQATVQAKSADPLSTIAEAIDRYLIFIKGHKERLLHDRVTKYEVQSWNDQSELPSPFNISLSFHVKEDLIHHSNSILLNKNDGALYLSEKKHRGWGRYTDEWKFEGLIQRADDISALIAKIQKSYEERGMKS